MSSEIICVADTMSSLGFTEGAPNLSSVKAFATEQLKETYGHTPTFHYYVTSDGRQIANIEFKPGAHSICSGATRLEALVKALRDILPVRRKAVIQVMPGLYAFVGGGKAPTKEKMIEMGWSRKFIERLWDERDGVSELPGS